MRISLGLGLGLGLGVSLSLTFGVCGMHAGDWRQFRGPDGGSSPEENVPFQLEGGKHAGWSAALPGRGLSSPIIVGDRVFVTCSSGPQLDRLHVVCIEASSGRKLWERQFWATGRTTCHEKISVAAPTPTSDGTHVYALFSSNDLICLDLEGNLVWLRGLMLDYPNASNGLGMSSSPVVADGTVVAQVETDGDAFVVGIDAATGNNRWKIARAKRVNWTSPLVVREGQGQGNGQSQAGRALVLLQSAGGLTAVTAAKGEGVWNWKEGISTVPSSSISNGRLFVPAGGLTALTLTSAEGGGAAPKQLWRSGQLRTGTSSPVSIGDRVFLLNDGGVLTCAEAGSGTRSWQLRLKGPFSASPVATAKHVYTVNEKGLIQVVDPSKPEGEVVSERDLGEAVIATPSIANGAVYVRSDAHLWRFAAP